MSNAPVTLVPFWTVEELTGDRRVIQLGGRALPRRGVAFGVKQRNEVVYPQGNPNASVSVAGPEEQETPISGAWTDKYLGGVVPIAGSPAAPPGQTGLSNRNRPVAAVGDTAITTAQGLVDLFDEVCRIGGLLKVTWGAVTRVGILDTFMFKYDTIYDVEWEMKFVWTGRDVPSVAAAFSPEYADRAFSRSLMDQLTSLSNQLTAPFTAVQSVMDDYARRLNDVQQVFNTLMDIADTAITGVLSPFDAARTTVDMLYSMGGGLDTWAEDVGNRAIETFLSPLDSIVTGSDGATVGDVVRANLWRNELLDSITQLSVSLQERALAVESRLGDDNVETYVANGNETLKDVAELYYGSAAAWTGLLKYNSLKQTSLARGQIVLVPEVPQT